MAARTPRLDPCLLCQTRRLFQRHSPRVKFSERHQRHQSTRPPTAPKQTPNIKHIRQNVELYAKNCAERNYQAHASYPEQIRRLSDELPRINQEVQVTREARNLAADNVKKLQLHLSDKKEGLDQLDRIIKEAGRARELKTKFQALKTKSDASFEQVQSLALALPNLTSPSTPTDPEPKVLEHINYEPSAAPPKPSGKSHVEIGLHLSLLDFTSSSTSTGWGWYFLLNDAVLLEQALINHALTIGAQHGFHPVSPPSIVYSHIAEACGFSPRDQNNEQQIYHLAQPSSQESNNSSSTKPQRSLAATAEIPLAAIYANHSIPSSSLPIKLIGPSRCYRAESGARGADTKGLYRVHEFTKVEMFAWTDAPSPHSNPRDTDTDTDLGPSDPSFATAATETFNDMLTVQKAILAPLGLPLRILEMPAADLGASAYRKIDIETFFPSRFRPANNRENDNGNKNNNADLNQHESSGSGSGSTNDGWGELSSLSICTDYQSRRLDTRIIPGPSPNPNPNPNGGKKYFAHTVNGTAVAVPRVLAALLEWGWREEGGYVVVPECLRLWMGGKSRIEAQR